MAAGHFYRGEPRRPSGFWRFGYGSVDLANDTAAFPAQVAGASKRLEIYLENLTPWQPKKLYFFSDADDQKQFAGTGPAYSVRQISPSQKKTVLAAGHGCGDAPFDAVSGRDSSDDSHER